MVNMAKCLSCETTEGLVYSGVDALILGIDGAQTGTRCYSCATKERNLKQTTEKDKEDGSI
jgi:hypothetical protein